MLNRVYAKVQDLKIDDFLESCSKKPEMNSNEFISKKISIKFANIGDIISGDLKEYPFAIVDMFRKKMFFSIIEKIREIVIDDMKSNIRFINIINKDFDIYDINKLINNPNHKHYNLDLFLLSTIKIYTKIHESRSLKYGSISKRKENDKLNNYNLFHYDALYNNYRILYEDGEDIKMTLFESPVFYIDNVKYKYIDDKLNKDIEIQINLNYKLGFSESIYFIDNEESDNYRLYKKQKRNEKINTILQKK